MKILHITTYDIQGGAARAAYRLHKGLRQIEQNSQMLVRYKSSTDDSVVPLTPAPPTPDNFFLETIIQENYIDSHRTPLSDTIFSLPYPGYDLSILTVVQMADVINLHWVARFQSPFTLQKLFTLGKPIVWTLHDQWAFTGGCHYSAGCKKYRHDCASCPQLIDDSFNLPKAVLKDKIALFKNANLAIVSPSHWLASCAQKSKLFKDLRVEVIPYSLEVETFSPLPKPKAKKKLGLGPETITILFGAVDAKEKRKGFQVLLAAMQRCLSNAKFQQLIADERLKILSFGHLNDDLKAIDIPVLSLGYLESDEKISLVYSAADLFVLPSLEDNSPLTMLEAMSCGTPVIGSSVGGIPDMVKDEVTGKLFSPGESKKLSEAILSFLFNSKQQEIMGQNCRQLIEKDYALPVQAKRYLDLYQDLLEVVPRPLVSNKILNQTNKSKPNPPGDLSVSIEATLGPHFQQIYDPVLLKALQEYAPLIKQKWQMSEADRSARFKQIEELSRLLKESEEDRSARFKQTEELSRLLKESEADRSARLEQIEELSRLLKESEADRSARFKQIENLSQLLKESETDRNARLKQIKELSRLLKESEEDRSARFKQTEELSRLLKESETDRNARLKQIKELSRLLKESEEDRSARLKQTEELSQMLAAQKDLLELTQVQLEKFKRLPEIRLRKKLAGLLKKIP